MLTQCPQCQTIYQLGAAELSAARGYVECGECGYQFSALDRIADDPTFDEKNPLDAAPESPDETDLTSTETPEDSKPAPLISLVDEDPVVEPNAPELVDDQASNLAQDLLDDEQEQPLPNASLLADPDPDTEPQHDMDTTVELALLDEQPGGTEDSLTHSSATLHPDEHEILFTEPDIAAEEVLQSDEDNLGREVDAESQIDLDEVPPILQEELLALNSATKTPTRWYWSLFAAVLLIGLAIQGTWFYRQALLSQFPQVREPLNMMCDKIGCELEGGEPEEPIQLVSRDVRTHPRYQNALLVNASLVNSGAETTNFPTVQLGLFDNTGTAIGIRQFSPSEYLDKSINIAAGIPPGRSVHVVMELANAGDRASSFEFSFR